MTAKKFISLWGGSEGTQVKARTRLASLHFLVCINSVCMATSREIEAAWDNIINMRWRVDDSFNAPYIEPNEVQKLMSDISLIRTSVNLHSEDGRLLYAARRLVAIGRRNWIKFLDYKNNNERRIAQAFIGKSNIRAFIFNRDGFACLCCGSVNNLSLDHIVPIHRGGKNQISNLQTLCRSCNSSKGIAIIDYR